MATEQQTNPTKASFASTEASIDEFEVVHTQTFYSDTALCAHSNEVASFNDLSIDSGIIVGAVPAAAEGRGDIPDPFTIADAEEHQDSDKHTGAVDSVHNEHEDLLGTAESVHSQNNDLAWMLQRVRQLRLPPVVAKLMHEYPQECQTGSCIRTALVQLPKFMHERAWGSIWVDIGK